MNAIELFHADGGTANVFACDYKLAVIFGKGVEA